VSKILSKEKSLHPNKDGKLLEQEVELLKPVDGKVETIRFIPIPRKELRELLLKTGDKEETDKDTDADIVLEYCKEPKFTKEELINSKSRIISNIATTIFEHSLGKTMKKNKEE